MEAHVPITIISDKTLQKLFFTCALCLVCSLTSCVSQEAYRSALDKNGDLSFELAQQRQQIAQLQADLGERQRKVDDCTDTTKQLQQQAVESGAEIERQAEIYQARQAANQQQLDELSRQKQNLQQELNITQERYRQLEEVNSDQSATISDLRQGLEREQIAKQARIAQMANTYNKLVDSLESEIKRGEVTISKLQNRLSVNLVQEILFPSGSADLSDAGKKVISQVGDVLKGVEDKDIRIEGHSDNVQLTQSLQQRFPSNWELSAARAANVVRFLQDNVGIGGEKLSIGAYSFYRPVAPNDSEEGRAKNRRIQIVLVPIGQ